MTDYAIIQAGGNQVKVSEGATVRLEKLEGGPGTEVVFPNVLLVSTGGAVVVGQPFVAGAKVTAEILNQGRGKKIRMYRFKKKKGCQHTQGHRQAFTAVRIKGIVR